MLWISGRTDGHQQGRHIARDGCVIPYREWHRPDARAVILYLHGQGGHSGPFTAMGDHFFDMGFSVLAYDHRGFGLSREPRGDIPTYDRFVEDAQEMVRLARRRNPGKPLFLLGLSMGGHLALRTACRARGKAAGVITLSPGFKLRVPPPWTVVLRGALLAILSPCRYMPLDSHNVATTRSQIHLDGAMQDECWVTVYTARFHLAAVFSLKRLKRELPRLDVPVLFLQAGEDHLVCPEESRKFFQLIGHPDKEFRLLEGLYHNLVAEPEMPEIAQMVSEWICRRIPAAQETARGRL